MLGTMLSIKPIVDISTGEVEEAGKQRTRRKAMTWLRDKVSLQPELEHLWVCTAWLPTSTSSSRCSRRVTPATA